MSCASFEDLARALGAAGSPRPTNLGLRHRVRCPAHDDSNPSLDITDADGTTLFVCRAGCTQIEVLEALIKLGLWNSAGARTVKRVPAFRWEDHMPEPPRILDCCRRGPENGVLQCEHWRQFDVDMTLGRLRANLLEARDEVVQLYQTVKLALDAETLRAELNLAVEFGGSAIVPARLAPSIVEMAIDFVVAGAICGVKS